MSRARQHLALAWLAGFTLIDASIVSLALPNIANDFDRSIGELAWVTTGFLLALAATVLAAGRLSDRFGARRVLALGAVAFFVTTLASGLAPTFELLVAARIAQGMAGGVLYTVSLAIAVTAYPPERRAAALGIYFTSGALGAVIGPVLGGLLTDFGGWRLVFLAQLPLPLVVAVAGWLLLPGAGAARARRFDVAGIAAASLFVVAGTFALLELPESGASVPVVVAALVAIGALAAFVVIERGADEPAVRLEIFSNPRFVVASVAGAAAWFAIMSSTIYPAIYLQLGRGYSATDAGILLLAAPFVGLVFFPFAGRVVRALGVDLALLAGLGLLLGSALVMTTWGATTGAWLIVITNLVTGAGIALTLVASATEALSQFTPEEAGTGSALFNSLRQIGAAMGVALPAVAFELVAGGSRDLDATLNGSSAAFVLRFAVLSIPLILLLVVRRRSNPARSAAMT
ncbi:MAG: MFS transporter [Chloroflexota bacterium]|nr:MFS transporter [Chloroflexota bacterium]